MIISVVKDGSKHHPSGKSSVQDSPWKGVPIVYKVVYDGTHSRTPTLTWRMSPPCQKPITKPDPQPRKMRRAQQSRRQQLCAPNAPCIHLRRTRHLAPSFMRACFQAGKELRKWTDSSTSMLILLWILLCHHPQTWALAFTSSPAGHMPAVSIFLCLHLLSDAYLHFSAWCTQLCDFYYSSYLFNCYLQVLLQCYRDPDWLR